MKPIRITQDANSNLGAQVLALSKIIEQHKNDAENQIDFSGVSFVHPTTILGLSVLLAKFSKEGAPCQICNKIMGVEDYLRTVGFSEGLFPDLESEWRAKHDTYKGKQYLPIINFPTDKKEDSINFRNTVLSKLNELIAYKLGLTVSTIGHISFFISEFTDNIEHHAGVRRGRIMTQYYPTKGFLEICIVDEGKTLGGSYRESRKFGYVDDLQAISMAMQGKSTKSADRGFGIPTSTNLIINGLGGKLLLLSGKGMLTNDVVIEFPSTWPGTLLSIKIPQRPNPNWMSFI